MDHSHDIPSQAQEPQAYYGRLTPAEKDIMHHLSLMRDDEDAIRRIQIFVHIQSQNKELKYTSYTDIPRNTENMPAYKKYAGFLTETGESDSDRLSRILHSEHVGAQPEAAGASRAQERAELRGASKLAGQRQQSQ